MQEVRTLIILPDVLDLIKSEDEDRLEQLLDELENDDDIESLIGCYHDSGQVTYRVDVLEVNTSGTGYMEVNYTAHKYSGCKDIDLDEEGEMTIMIEIDLNTGRATLTGEKWPDREPDEY